MPAPRSGLPPTYSDPRTTTFALLVFPNTDSAQSAPDAKADLGKSVLEWLMVGILAVFVACFFIRRVLRQRRGTPDASADTDSDHQENPDLVIAE
ncbi:hypothetical protein GGX14DRAFT_564442 [Mycena pura]|uniref:Uncharacterized protein n=1 Tax=Mycena pura TaxID=153505 RepID=A0AAD6VH07_9AGAR|nr:hypothetical protein GGX14DRAFT_564442 [Mycena pura]